MDPSCSNVPPAPPQPLLHLQKPPAVSPVALTPIAGLYLQEEKPSMSPEQGRDCARDGVSLLEQVTWSNKYSKLSLKVPLSSNL